MISSRTARDRLRSDRSQTWEISFQSLRSESPAAADLLNLFAFFAPDAIRREWIIAGAEHLPETLAAAVNDELAFDDIAAAFRRYSLVEVSSEQNSFTAHRLVQTVIRARITNEENIEMGGSGAASVERGISGQ